MSNRFCFRIAAPLIACFIVFGATSAVFSDNSKADLALLNSRLKWNKAGKSQQDAVIRAIAKKLGADYEFKETKTYTCGGQSHRIASFTHVQTGLILNLVPGGKYQRGSKSAAAQEDEKSVASVLIPPLLVGKTEVTQKAWDKIQGKGVEDKRGFRGSELPIETVSWAACKAWLEKVRGQLRFLSEAEWEYACRAGTQTNYCFGDNKNGLGDCCWFSGNSGASTHPVGQKNPNAFGLHDMHGNVYEWCADGYNADYARVSNNHKPHDSPATICVLRGGGWNASAGNCRSANRSKFSASDRNYKLGFRVARTIN